MTYILQSLCESVTENRLSDEDEVACAKMSEHAKLALVGGPNNSNFSLGCGCGAARRIVEARVETKQ